jgi:hypothetical protein
MKMKIRNLIWILLLIPCVYAASSNVTVNDVELPATLNFSLQIDNPPENETVLINRVDSLSWNVTYNNTFASVPNQTSILAEFVVDIPFFTVVETKTDKVVFNIGATNSNTSYLYEIFITINDTTVLAELNDIESLQLLQGGNYEINYSTNVLPVSTKLPYTLNGTPNEILFIECTGEFLNCPDFVKFNGDGLVNVDIPYIIEWDADIGKYEDKITFKYGNITKNSFVTFNIIAPELVSREYVYPEECFVKQEGVEKLALDLECVEEREKENLEYLKEVFALARTNINKSEYCEDYVIYEDKYVVVGEVEEEFKEQLDVCKTERRDYYSELQSCLVEYSKFVQDFQANETEVSLNALSKAERALQDKEAKEAEAEAKIAEYERSRKIRRNWFIFLVSVVAIVVALVVLQIKKNKSLGFN